MEVRLREAESLTLVAELRQRIAELEIQVERHVLSACAGVRVLACVYPCYTRHTALHPVHRRRRAESRTS